MLLLQSFKLFLIMFILAIILIYSLTKNVIAKDYGVYGHTFIIKELDLLEFIHLRLKKLEENGQLKKLQERSIKEAKKKVNRPEAVKGLKYAIEDKSYYYDPSITLKQDYKDQNGVIFARKGTRINPLDNEYMQWRNNLIFIDGDNPEQVKWALSQNKKYNNKTKIILINGAVIDLMKQLQKKIYFDQGGVLVKKFSIQNIPAIITKHQDKLLIREVYLKYEK